MTTCARCNQDLPRGHASQLCRACLREVSEPMVNVAMLRTLLKRRPEWMQRAACRGMDPNIWHTEVFSRDATNPLVSHSVRVAKHVCATCPVREDCLREELEYEAKHGPQPGIRGGALPEERRRLGTTERVFGPGEPLGATRSDFQGEGGLGGLGERVTAILEAMDKQARAHGLKGAA